MTVKETRKPLPDLRGKATITVGIHGTEGGAEHSDPLQSASFADDGALEGAEGPPLTVAEVGAFHEFGTRHIPQRSFIRAWFDEAVASGEIADLVRSQLQLALKGRVTLDQALERVALKCEASMQKRITKRIPPPLAAATIAKKGSSVPLIDTGQLRASIRARVSRS